MACYFMQERRCKPLKDITSEQFALLIKRQGYFQKKQKRFHSKLASIVKDEMEMRLALRNTAYKIINLAFTLGAHLKSTIKSIEGIPNDKETYQLLPYLVTYQLLLLNIENHLDSL